MNGVPIGKMGPFPVGRARPFGVKSASKKMAAGGLPLTTLKAAVFVRRPVGSPPKNLREQSACAIELAARSERESAADIRDIVKIVSNTRRQASYFEEF